MSAVLQAEQPGLPLDEEAPPVLRVAVAGRLRKAAVHLPITGGAHWLQFVLESNPGGLPVFVRYRLRPEQVGVLPHLLGRLCAGDWCSAVGRGLACDGDGKAIRLLACDAIAPETPATLFGPAAVPPAPTPAP